MQFWIQKSNKVVFSSVRFSAISTALEKIQEERNHTRNVTYLLYLNYEKFGQRKFWTAKILTAKNLDPLEVKHLVSENFGPPGGSFGCPLWPKNYQKYVENKCHT